MRVEDFPRPKDDNRRGIHWSASVYHPTGTALDFWIGELRSMNIKWVKLLDDGGGSSLELCQRLLAADIMPVVRLYRLEPNPGHIGGREEETARRLIAAGVRYFECNNEPDLPAEWRGGRMPRDWLDIVADNFIIDAEKIIGMGGLPALPAMGVGSKDNLLQQVVDKGRADLFDNGVWIAIHNYSLNHPLDYPYDSVNQEGTPVSQDEFDRLGPWAWEGRSRDQINEWRRLSKNPGATLEDDPVCFLSFHLIDQWILKSLSHRVPIISTEGGPVIGWKDDRRYPRVDPATHGQWVVAINDFMQGLREIHGLRCPDSYFAMCHWLLGNYRLGFMAPGWESQSWYTDWWNADFDLRGELPAVAAVKAMPNLPVDQARQALVSGQVLRADTDEPLPDLEVLLLFEDRIAARTITSTSGAFLFEHLRASVYDLAIQPWGVLRRGISATEVVTTPVIIRLTGGRSSNLTGLVLGASHQLLAGIEVVLSREGVTVGQTTTASDGSFRFTELPLGTYQLTIPGITVAGVALDGWQSKNVKLTAGTAASYRYVVTKQRLLPVEETASRRIFFGSVCDSAGAPINGVRLQMGWTNPEPGVTFPITTTGQDPYRPAGTYEFPHSPGIFNIQVVQGDWPSDSADDLNTASVPGRANQPVAYEVNFQLQPVGSPAQISGIVLGAEPGRLVRLTGDSETKELALTAEGQFAFSNLAAGRYALELAEVGVIAGDIALGPGTLYKLLFPMRGRLSGHVIAPPDDLTAVLHAPSAWGWTRQVLLEPDGQFVFDRLPPGHYRLEVGDQVLSDLVLTGENHLQLAPIDLARGQRSIIRGRVADGAGTPQVDIEIVLQCEGLLVAQTHTGADGTYQFIDLPAGIYAISAIGLGEVASGIMLDGEREHVADVLWARSGPRSTLQGRVLTASKTPLPSVTVRLMQGATQVTQTVTDEAGGFRFTGLPASTYALALFPGTPSVTDVRLDDDATATRDIVLPPEPSRPIGHYVLFGRPPAYGTPGYAEARLIMTLAAPFLARAGVTGGFDYDEARHASRITIMGDQLPVTAETALRSAGCEVTRLSGDAYAIAAALDRLLAEG